MSFAKFTLFLVKKKDEKKRRAIKSLCINLLSPKKETIIYIFAIYVNIFSYTKYPTNRKKKCEMFSKKRAYQSFEN